ncbi:Flp pilus assembly protein CpaB [Oryzibacter oryziterrae]|uniref:Flp pilus assembly protein CpaB n=1 Tax=Oryzibacter oryziterrae TaxID=2766474 RepID=UPI001F304581|nr:Flp pilus assembly protein CpaB [Oryzibacter oryziterrae]
MRSSVKVMLLLAIVCGGGAVWFGQRWLDTQTSQRIKEIEAARPEITFATLVVAAEPLRFGSELTRRQLKEIPWPSSDLPIGAFATIDDLLRDGGRTVLFPLEASEPILSAKVTGPGERAALSRLIGAGNRAVTLKVNDVAGVGGFVLPGDHVDVVLTGKDRAEVILQDVRILSIDQSADERTNEPKVARTVTVEANPENAQKLVLAQDVGSLSLVLRRAGEVASASVQPITSTDLSAASTAKDTGDSDSAVIWVRRATDLTQYNVPVRSGGPVRPVNVIALPVVPGAPQAQPIDAVAVVPASAGAPPADATNPASGKTVPEPQ